MNKSGIAGLILAVCLVFQLQMDGYAQSDTHRRYIVTAEADCNELTFDGYAYSGAMNQIRMDIQSWWGPDNTGDCTAEVIISPDYTGDYIDLDASIYCVESYYEDEVSLYLNNSIALSTSGLKTMIFRSENPELGQGFKLRITPNSTDVSEDDPNSWIFPEIQRRIVFEETEVFVEMAGSAGIRTGRGVSFINCDLYFTNRIKHLTGSLLEMVSCTVHKANPYASHQIFHTFVGYVAEVKVIDCVFEHSNAIYLYINNTITDGNFENTVVEGNRFNSTSSIYIHYPSLLNNEVYHNINCTQNEVNLPYNAGLYALMIRNPRRCDEKFSLDIVGNGFDYTQNVIPFQCYFFLTDSSGAVDSDDMEINWIDEENAAITYLIEDNSTNVDFTYGVWIHDRELPGPVKMYSDVSDTGDPDVRRTFVVNNTIKSIVRQSLYMPPIYRQNGMDFNPKVSQVLETSGFYDLSWDFGTNLSAANGPFLLEAYRSNSRGDLLERIHQENLAYDASVHTLSVAESAGASQWVSLTVSSYGYDVNNDLTDNSLGTSEAIAIPLKIPVNIPQSVCADGTPLSISIPPIPMNNGGVLYPISWNVEMSSGGSTTDVTPVSNTSPELVLDNPQPGDYHVTLTVGTPTDYTYVRDYVFTVNTEENCISNDQCIGSFSPEVGEYMLQAWVSEEHIGPVSTYSHTGIRIELLANQEIVEQSELFLPSGEIIDSWQRIEEKFTVPLGVDQIRIALENTSGDIVGYIDDIRIQPVSASSKSYVYDPVLGKLRAEMDENNYATFYDYNREGKLIRVRKETERGIMTIQETNYNSSQLNQ